MKPGSYRCPTTTESIPQASSPSQRYAGADRILRADTRDPMRHDSLTDDRSHESCPAAFALAHRDPRSRGDLRDCVPPGLRCASHKSDASRGVCGCGRPGRHPNGGIRFASRDRGVSDARACLYWSRSDPGQPTRRARSPLLGLLWRCRPRVSVWTKGLSAGRAMPRSPGAVAAPDRDAHSARRGPHELSASYRVASPERFGDFAMVRAALSWFPPRPAAG